MEANRTASVIEVNEANFEVEVIHRSDEVPVVVDFWAPWCGPCRALGPVLEKLAQESDGGWILAKLNTDENPNLSAAAGIKGIPAVKAFVEGREVESFTGAIPESQVRQWLSKFVPDKAEEIANEGLAHELRGEFDSATLLFDKALEINPNNETALSGIDRLQQRAKFSNLDESALLEELKAKPHSVEAAFQLSKLRMLRGDEDFYEELLKQVRQEEGSERDEARIRLLELLDMTAPGDPRTITARKKLSASLF